MHYTKNYHLPQWEKSDRIMTATHKTVSTNKLK